MSEIMLLLNKWLRKREGLLISLVTFLFYIIIVAVALLLRLAGKIDNITLLSTIFSLLIFYLPIHIFLIRKRNQANLISCTSKYLLLADESKIDDLLSIILGGKWDKLKLDPIDEFFTCLKKILYKSDYYMRRRVAEALPALFSIDVEESEDLTKILRIDWDDSWKSDNRRRTIESLSYIVKKNKKFVKDNLRVFDGDEIFTIIAILEVICKWGDDNTTSGHAEREKMFNDLIDQMKSFGYDSSHIEAISSLKPIFDLMHSNPSDAIKRFNELKDDPNIYTQIGIARNLNCFCTQFPEGSLNLMAEFIADDRHKYVRRPISKENNVECLLRLLQNRKYAPTARDILWSLINDKDSIIRETTFDNIEKILDIDKEFAYKILNRVIDMNLDSKVVRRAEYVLERHTDS